MDLGEKLKRARKMAGMTGAEVQKHTGIKRSTLSNYENGFSRPDTDTLFELINLYQADPKVFVQLPAYSWAQVPIYGVIRAGEPAFAEEHIGGYEMADVPDPKDYFFLRIAGDSMVGAGIFDGDLALIKKQEYADNGQIVAVLIDGLDAMLKRYQQDSESVTFWSENPNYPPKVFTNSQINNDPDYVRILGVLKKVVKTFN